ncbi:MAG: pilus assembly protein N-terminal domain-containing protein [Deltaproteobacteria bacterium]|nr:pilus assembly protein N-terminal domain-containing protein [Deltaproteobacteria bacterium]
MKTNIPLFALLMTTLVAAPQLCLGKAANKRIELDQYPSLTLVSGVTHTIHLSFLPGIVSVGDSSVCDYVVLPEQRQLQLVPKKTGNTNIVVRDRSGKERVKQVIFVTKSDLAKIVNELKSLLGQIEGIEIKIVGNRVVIDGELLLPADVSRVVAVVSQYEKSEVAIIAILSNIAQQVIAQKIEKDIDNPEVHVRAVNGHFLVEGVVDSEADAIRSMEIAKTYLPDAFVSYGEKVGMLQSPQPMLAVVNLLRVRPTPPPAPGKTIKVTAYYVELSKDFLKSFAFQWTPTLFDNTEASFSSTTGQIGGALTGTIKNLLPKLNRAREHGHARILKTSSVLIKEGRKGVLKNETKIPYTALGRRGDRGTKFASTGLATTVEPTLLPSAKDAINLNVDFTLSALISVNQEGQPSITTNKVTTELVVSSGESAAIAGVVDNSVNIDFNRLPAGIQSSDPLFTLLRSKAFRQKKSQFVIFLHPEILPSASYGSKEIEKKFRLKRIDSKTQAADVEHSSEEGVAE